ncbi:TVP38/TMEM64 family protein [Modestobacter lacusdianchii]
MHRWWRAVLLTVAVLVVVGLAWQVDVPTATAVRDRFRAPGPADWWLALLGLSLALLLPTPRSALSVLAGAVFGLSAGLALVLAAALAGGIGGFGASRWLGRSLVQRAFRQRLNRVDEVLSRHGVLAVLTARMLPAPPFAVVSYAAGVSGIALVHFAVGTAVGVIPGSVLYVSLGAAAGSADGWWAGLQDRPWLASLAGLVAVALLALWWLRRGRHSHQSHEEPET